MRPINVTLCSTTWELAKQKANFSGWVREKLADESRIAAEKAEKSDERPHYGAYCDKCDKHFNHYQDFMMKHYFCKFCHNETKYMGLLE